jgi:hypothetical protein
LERGNRWQVVWNLCGSAVERDGEEDEEEEDDDWDVVEALIADDNDGRVSDHAIVAEDGKVFVFP